MSDSKVNTLAHDLRTQEHDQGNGSADNRVNSYTLGDRGRIGQGQETVRSELLGREEGERGRSEISRAVSGGQSLRRGGETDRRRHTQDIEGETAPLFRVIP